jgi:acetyl-CoA C-acetyltransferase
MPDALIVNVLRTPIGRAAKGSLREVRPDDLAARVIAATVARSGVDAALIDDHALGTAFPQGKQGQNLARRASLLAGLPVELPGTTINRFCASSLQAVRIAAHAIRSGEADAYLVSGVESVSQVDSTDAEQDLHPAFTSGELTDVYVPMGITAENVAERFNVSREDMDAFALESHRKAVRAQEDGRLARDILPFEMSDGSIVEKDDGPRQDTSLERLAALKPAFREGGVVTAGNSCPLNDGASAAVLVSDKFAERENLAPRARIVATAVSGVDPAIMGVGPIAATRKVLRRAGLSIDDIDIVEFNEAFASQVLAVVREVGIAFEQLNPAGGAIAFGHPFGMTGIRLLCNLLTNLDACSGRYGLATLCVGGGQGLAAIVERMA